MRNICRFLYVLVIVFGTSISQASIVLENFESGTLPGDWTATGTAWKVGGATGGSPNVLPGEGSFFARSGEPNAVTESATGTLTSRPYTVTYTTLEWLQTGWSDSGNDGANYFSILDGSFTELTRVSAAQDDDWVSASVNLLDIGLLPGATFYFQAVDGRNQSGYAWMGFDALTLTGEEVAGVVPEATSFLTWGVLALVGLGSAIGRRRRGSESLAQ